MRHVEHGMRSEREGEDGERLPRLLDHAQPPGEQEADSQRDVEADARLVLPDDGETDVGACRQGQEQRGQLRQPQLVDEPLRRRRRQRHRPGREPGEAGGQAAEADQCRPQRVAHAVSRKVSGSRL